MITSTIQADLACPVERVWAVLTDLTCQDWRSDIERVEITGEDTFVEYTKGGVATYFTVTRHEPPGHWADGDQRATWAFSMENENMTGSWTGKLEPSDSGCRVTFTEEVDARKCWMRPLVKSYLKQQEKRHLSDLKKALGLC